MSTQSISSYQLALLTVIARLSSAAMTSSIVVFIYLIGKKLYGRRGRFVGCSDDEFVLYPRFFMLTRQSWMCLVSFGE